LDGFRMVISELEVEITTCDVRNATWKSDWAASHWEVVSPIFRRPLAEQSRYSCHFAESSSSCHALIQKSRSSLDKVDGDTDSLPNQCDTLAQALGDLFIHPPQCLFRPIAAVEIIGRKERPKSLRNLFTAYPLDFCEALLDAFLHELFHVAPLR